MPRSTVAADLLARHARGEIRKPCAEALKWLGRRRSMRRAWHDCPRGDWQLWLAHEYGHHPPIDWTAREIVSYAFGYAGDALYRASLADHAATMWHHRDALRGATPETAHELLGAARAAAWAAKNAARAAAWAAKNAARAAAGAAKNAAWAAAGAAGAAEDAAWAASWTAGGAAMDAGDVEHRRCADAVRQLWPSPPWEDQS